MEHGAKKHQEGDGRGCRVKVPANGFLLFRADYKAIQANQVAADGLRKKQTEVTKDAAVAWKALHQVVRDDYLARARHNLAEHKREHREFWSRCRGRDGRFLPVPPGAAVASSAHGDSQPDGTVSSQPHLSDSFLPPSGSSLIRSLDVAPGVILDSLDLPVFHSSATTSSDVQPLRFYDPFCVGPAFGPPPFALPFHQISAASSNERQPFPVPASSSVNFVTSALVDTFLHDPMQPATPYLPLLDTAYSVLDLQENAFSYQDTDPLHVRSRSTHDLSSRTLTLSRSDWERVDLFLRISSNSTSGASTSTTNHPACIAL
ncbi:hypothetical protein V8D89_002968 [Ganoderma adspersum]